MRKSTAIKVNLFFAIMLAVATTASILLSFVLLEPSKSNMLLISLFSIIGFGGTILYIDNYKELKREGA